MNDPQPFPSLDELAADPGRARELPPETAADLLARLAGLQPVLLARAWSTHRASLATRGAPDADRLLTIPEVAARLGVPKGYAYDLARRRELPTVRIGPKYVRVSTTALAAWVSSQQKELDGGMYQRYSVGRDRQRASATPPRRPRPHPGGAR